MGNFFITPFDKELCSQVELIPTISGSSGQTRKKAVIKFQFPPHIKSDSKGIDYKESSMMNVEPLALFNGSKSRTISLYWVYIVDGDSWKATEVRKMVQAVRSFFYVTADKVFTDGDLGFVIKFHAYNVFGGAGQQFSCRSDGVEVSHGETMIKDDGILPTQD